MSPPGATRTVRDSDAGDAQPVDGDRRPEVRSCQESCLLVQREGSDQVVEVSSHHLPTPRWVLRHGAVLTIGRHHAPTSSECRASDAATVHSLEFRTSNLEALSLTHLSKPPTVLLNIVSYCKSGREEGHVTATASGVPRIRRCTPLDP